MKHEIVPVLSDGISSNSALSSITQLVDARDPLTKTQNLKKLAVAVGNKDGNGDEADRQDTSNLLAVALSMDNPAAVENALLLQVYLKEHPGQLSLKQEEELRQNTTMENNIIKKTPAWLDYFSDRD